MRLVHCLTSLLLYTSFTAAWPWPPTIGGMQDLVLKRQDSNNGNSNSNNGNNGNNNNGNSNDNNDNNNNKDTPSASPSNGDSAAPSAAPTSGATQTPAATSGSKSGGTVSNATITASPSIDPQAPAGGIVMMTPAPGVTTYYKIGEKITFVWNYTSIQAKPSALNVLVTRASNHATYTIASNFSVQATGSVVWDTSAFTNGVSPLLTNRYNLVIYDAGGLLTDPPQPGRLAPFNQLGFAMYLPQKPTTLSNLVCTTCSGALSDTDRQTLRFAFAMGIITVLSFTWFAGSFAVF